MVIFFGCKILTKMIGIIYLDFHKLYWLVFLMGDSAMVFMIAVSIIIIRIQLYVADSDYGVNIRI